MNEIRLGMLAPIEPSDMTPLQGTNLGQSGNIFIWDIGTLNISSYRFFLSNNPSGHLDAEPAVVDQFIYVSSRINGNVFKPNFIPQGIDIVYATLEYTSGSEKGYLQQSYGTLPLRFLNVNDGDTLPFNVSFKVDWTSSGLNDRYTLRVYDKSSNQLLSTYEDIRGAFQILTRTKLSYFGGVTGEVTLEVEFLNRDGNPTITVDLLTSTELPDIFNVEFSAWQGFSLTFESPSYVNKYLDGTTARYAASPNMKETVAFSLAVNRYDTSTLIFKMREYKNNSILPIPLWHFSISCFEIIPEKNMGVGFITYTAKESEELPYLPISVGDSLLVWVSSSNYRLGEVSGISGNDITILGGVSNATSLVPIRDGRITFGGMLQHNQGHLKVEVEIELIEDRFDTIKANEWTTSLPEWYNDATNLIEYIPNDFTVKYSDSITDVSSKVFTEEILNTERRQITGSMTVPLPSRRSIGELFQLLTKMRGVQNSFQIALPTNPFDVRFVTQDSVSVLSPKTVAEVDKLAIPYLSINGVVREVDSIYQNSGTVVFLLTAGTTVDTSSDSYEVFPVIDAHLDGGGIFTINFLTNYLASTSLTFREIPKLNRVLNYG